MPLSLFKMRKSFSTKFNSANLIGVGAARCGTTTLYDILSRFSNVSVSSLKEANYWGIRQLEYNTENGLSAEDYANLFKPARYRAEVTPVYLSNPHSLREIKNNVSDAKIIIVLRDPIDRLYSHFKHFLAADKKTLNHGFELENFDGFVSEAIYQYRLGNISYHHWKSPQLIIAQSLYTEHVKKAFRYFGKENVLILSYEGLCVDQRSWICALEDFLDEKFLANVDTIVRLNASPSYQAKIHPETISTLKSFFRDDVEELVNYLNLPSMSNWIKNYE